MAAVATRRTTKPTKRKVKTVDWMNAKKRAGLAAGAVLVGVLLAGCGGGTVPNQRVYDRYATLMQERYRQQMQPSGQTAEKAAPAKPQTAPAAKPEPAAPSKPAKTAEAPAAPAKNVQPVAEPKKAAKSEKTAKPDKPAKPVPEPAPVADPVEPEPVKEAIPDEPNSGPVSEPAVEIATEPEAVPDPEPVPEPPAPVEVVVPETPVLPPPLPPPPPAYEPAHDNDAAKDETSAYALKIGDGVQIALRSIPTPEKIECQVDEYGMVALPLINDVKAEGLSGAELAKNIRQIYLERGIYKNINVTVLIPTRYYFTQGEFKSTGKFQLVSAINLSQAIAGSGYFTDFASGTVLIRRDGKIFKTVKNAKRLDRTPEDDILIEPGDIIEAKRSYW